MLEMIWVTREGKSYRIYDMETRHINNCIRMIQRSIARGRPWRVRYLARLELELEIRALRQ